MTEMLQFSKDDTKLQVNTAAASKEEEEDGDNEHSNKDEEEEHPSKEEEENDENHDIVGFGDAMNKILTQNVAEDVQPILAKRTTARMREIQSDKKETKTARLSAAEKREREQKDMALPDPSTAGQDRKLRMIATKGVVALFNAIEKHQQQNGRKEDRSDKKVKEMSKDNFLSLLKASQQKTTTDKPVKTAKSSWSVVQDDFMMEAKLKDWDNQHGTEVGRVRQKGDADVEAVEDVAWKQAGDALDSDTEAPRDTKNTTNKRQTMSAITKKKKNQKKVKRSTL